MLLGLFVALTLSLPAPSGPLHIGTQVRTFLDTKRPDPVSHTGGRAINVQFWYPTDIASDQTAPYLIEPGLLKTLEDQQYYGQSNAALEAWGTMHTHAFMDEAISWKRKWPIVLLEPGLGMPRANYTIYCEDLASHGYYVAAIEPPHGGLTVMTDGRVFSAGDDARNSDPAKQVEVVSEWAGDMRFVLDWIEAQSLPVDVSRVCAMGHSMGGSAAFQACLDDHRIDAAVDLDGSGGVSGLEHGARASLLWVRSNPNYSDADLKKLGRTRAQWIAMGKRGPGMFPQLAKGVKSAPVYQISIRDTGHLSYSDAPYVMPNTITRFSDHSLPPARTLELTTMIVRAFLDQVLFGKKWPALKSGRSPWPEVKVTKVYS